MAVESGVSIVAQQVNTRLVSIRMQVQSPALLSELRCGSDPVLLWLWCRWAAAAPSRPLPWELPYAKGAAQKKKKKKKKKKETFKCFHGKGRKLVIGLHFR